MARIPETVGAGYSFEAASARYAARPDYPQGFYAELFNRLQPAGKFGLDLGCGDGRVALRLAEGGAKIAGLDLASGMLGHLQSRLKLHPASVFPLRGDAGQIPCARLAFDFVLTGQALHWMEKERVGAEVRRVLRPAGWWVVFWSQPVEPEAVFIQVSDRLIAEVVPGYDPAAAHNLSERNRIPPGFAVHKWQGEVASQTSLEIYVAACASKSFVANALASQSDRVAFERELARRLNAAGYEVAISERNLLTALFATPIPAAEVSIC